MRGQGLKLTVCLVNNEIVIARGVSLRKLTPCEYIHRPTEITSNPLGAKEISSSVLYFFSPPLSFQRKRKIIKSGAYISPETFKFKVDQALSMYHRQQFHPGREVD